MKKLLLITFFALTVWSIWGQARQPVSREQLILDFQAMSPVLFNLYRKGHEEPELGLACYKTSIKIKEAIRELGMVEGRDYELIDNLAQTGFVIILRNGEGPVVAWRFDMDALPLHEETGLPYAALEGGGVMHGCAHDIHFSTGVGILAQMHRNRQAWRGTAIFIAQPGEEGANGARIMVEQGMYRMLAKKNAFPQKIVFIHAFDKLPAGSVGIRSGETMAGVGTWNLTIRAKGGHGGRGGGINELANDFEDFYYRIPTRVSPFEDFSVNIAGRVMDTTINVNPERITLKLSARFMNMALKDSMERFFIPRICKGLTQIYDLPDSTFTLTSIFWSHKLVNDDSLFQQMRRNMQNYIADTAAIRPIERIMSSEDATWFSVSIQCPDGKYRNIPLLMVRLGIQDPDKYGSDFRLLPGQHVPGIHTKFIAPFYEKAIETGVVTIGGAFIRLFE